MKTRQLAILMVLLLVVFACSNDSEDDFINPEEIENPDDGTPDGSLVNYVDDIEPIMRTACTSCHGQPPTNGAPFALVNFNQVNQRASSILNRMSLSSGSPGAMPPSGRLPQATIDLIQQWIDDGKPEN